ncbi:MAG TPA: lipoprotein [Xanthomonadales bacterium]|nr:lipoprotein [Xanthomonadales bacterium]
MIVLMRRTLLAATLAAALAGCSNNEAPTDPLAYVPADSPYVMANHTPTPKAVVQAWLAMYGDNMEEIYADMANDPELKAIEGEFGEWVRAAMPEFGKMTSVDGIEELGLKAEGRFAAYGYGLMPVYRMELSDSKNLAATIARIEERAGKKLAKRKLGETELWQFANDKAIVLFGAVGNFLVVTLAPAKADDARLSAQVGLTLPEASMASSGAFAELDKKYGYDGHVSGFIDIRALAQRLTGRNQDDNQVISAFGGEVPKLSDACASELDLMTQKFPRMVFGTTVFDDKQMNVSSLIEVEAELAKSMQKIAAPIPGAGSKDAMMLRFAASVDLPETVRFLNGVADSIAAKPYQCEELKDINTSAAEMKQNLANPGMAMAGAVNALHFGLKSMQMEAGSEMPSAVSAFLTLGSSSPLMLWGLAQQGVPALAQIQLAADGKIVALPADALPMPIPVEFKAVMTDKSIGVATKDIDDASFTAAATVPASADGTVLRYGFTGDFFKLIAEQVPAPTPEMDEKAAKDAERGRKMIAGMGEKIGQMDVRMQLTARGIEFVQENTLK